MYAPDSITNQVPLSNQSRAALEDAGREFKKFIEAETGLPSHLNTAVSINTFERAIRNSDGNDVADCVKRADAAGILAAAQERFALDQSRYRRHLPAI